jgi:hypothetical protein
MNPIIVSIIDRTDFRYSEITGIKGITKLELKNIGPIINKFDINEFPELEELTLSDKYLVIADAYNHPKLTRINVRYFYPGVFKIIPSQNLQYLEIHNVNYTGCGSYYDFATTFKDITHFNITNITNCKPMKPVYSSGWLNIIIHYHSINGVDFVGGSSQVMYVSETYGFFKTGDLRKSIKETCRNLYNVGITKNLTTVTVCVVEH